MPILQENKAIFVHIPKTGGTSVEAFFRVRRKDGMKVLWQQKMYKVNKIACAPQHFPLSEILKRKPECKDWPIFTVVSNPYQRLLSEYFWRHDRGANKGKFLFNEDEFYNWIDNKLKFTNDHSMPQSWFLDKWCPIILRQENLKEDIEKYLFPILNITDREFLNKNNVRKNKHYPNYKGLKQKTLDNIYNLYKEDFERFGYKRLIHEI